MVPPLPPNPNHFPLSPGLFNKLFLSEEECWVCVFFFVDISCLSTQRIHCCMILVTAYCLQLTFCAYIYRSVRACMHMYASWTQNTVTVYKIVACIIWLCKKMTDIFSRTVCKEDPLVFVDSCYCCVRSIYAFSVCVCVCVCVCVTVLHVLCFCVKHCTCVLWNRPPKESRLFPVWAQSQSPRQQKHFQCPLNHNGIIYIHVASPSDTILCIDLPQCCHTAHIAIVL